MLFHGGFSFDVARDLTGVRPAGTPRAEAARSSTMKSTRGTKEAPCANLSAYGELASSVAGCNSQGALVTRGSTVSHAASGLLNRPLQHSAETGSAAGSGLRLPNTTAAPRGKKCGLRRR